MREYFCAYHSMLAGTRKLSDAECGRLFRALLTYSAGADVGLINLQGREEVLFDVYSQQIDRDIEAYEATIAKNRENGSKGGRPRKNPENPENPPVFSKTQKSQDKDKDKDKDKDDYLKKRFDQRWRTSARARAATAQIVLDEIEHGKLGRTGCTNMHEYICNLMSKSVSPERILQEADSCRSWAELNAWISMNGGVPDDDP